MHAVIVAPLLLAFDFAWRCQEVERAQAGGSDWHHCVHCHGGDRPPVDNLSLGPALVSSLAQVSRVPRSASLGRLGTVRLWSLGRFVARACSLGILFFLSCAGLDFGSPALAVVGGAGEAMGAAARPGGQPLGGGRGYTAAPSRDHAAYRVDSLESLQRALRGAKPGEVVWIKPGSFIDFTGVRLEVPAGVTLAGDRGESEGPLLYARHTGSEYFIQLRRGARLTGVRVRGSNPLLKDTDAQRNDPPGYAVLCADAEVDNCEISQFQRGGVGLFRDSAHSWIHHNFIHDIGAYPVVLGNGTGDGHVIEGNRIEWAWHAVASNGSRGSGYVVRHNEFVRVPRPRRFEEGGADTPNWCLDTHSNEGAPTRPDRPATRRLVVEHNTFLADPAVRVGNGSELLDSAGGYPKHDVFVGAGRGLTTTVEIWGNRFLMHEKAGSPQPLKPYGRAIRLVGLRGQPGLPDDPGAALDVWRVTLGKNRFSGAP